MGILTQYFVMCMANPYQLDLMDGSLSYVMDACMPPPKLSPPALLAAKLENHPHHVDRGFITPPFLGERPLLVLESLLPAREDISQDCTHIQGTTGLEKHIYSG